MSLAISTTLASVVSAVRQCRSVLQHPHEPAQWWREQHRPAVSRHMENMKPEPMPSTIPSTVSLQKRSSRDSNPLTETATTSIFVPVTSTHTVTHINPGATDTYVNINTNTVNITSLDLHTCYLISYHQRGHKSKSQQRNAPPQQTVQYKSPPSIFSNIRRYH